MSYNAQTIPDGIVIADFDGDGKRDVAVANYCNDAQCDGPGSVTVMLGNGDGTLRPGVSYDTGLASQAVTTADLNHDGKPDLVVPNYGDNTISVLLNNGNGTFAPAVSYATGTAPSYVAVGDFNGDGKLDLAVTNTGDASVLILIGDGHGAFASGGTYPVVAGPFSVAAGDVDGDGKLDLVVPNEGDTVVSVLRGNGNGTFQAAVNYQVGSAPYSVAVADFDGDGKLDIVTANLGDNDASVLLNRGDGTFRNAVNYAVGSFPAFVVVADLNRDGIPDLAVANYADNTLSVLRGNGDGTFLAAAGFDAGAGPLAVAAGDLNGDGAPDLAVADYEAGVTILLSASPAPAVITSPAPNSTLAGSAVTFQWSASGTATAYWIDVGSAPGSNQYFQSGSLPTSTLAMSVTTLPIDGSTVYVTMYSKINGVWVNNAYTYTAFNLGAAKGVITTPTPGSTLTGNSVSFTWTAGQGATNYWLDIGSTLGGNQYFQSGPLGNVLTTTATTLPLDGSTVYVTLWTFVGGQWLSNSYIYTALNLSTAQGVLTTPPPGSTLPDSSANFAWTAGIGATAYEIDAGSSPAGNQYFQSGNLGTSLHYIGHNMPTNSSTVYVTLYSLIGGTWYHTVYTYTAAPPAVTFLPAVHYPAGLVSWALTTGDLNGDGKPDLAVANSASSNVSVLLGNGDGTFRAVVNYATGQNPQSVAIGDFNGDGNADLVTANHQDGNVSVLLGNGDGTFRAAVNFTAGAGPHSVAVGDFNHDGHLNVAVANELSNNMSVLLGNGNGTFQPAVNYPAGSHPLQVAVGDVNGDGMLDLVVANQQSNNVSVFLGRGDGAFLPAVNYSAGNGCNAVVMADLNNDGKLDLAVADYSTGGVAILLGQGDGTFPTLRGYPGGNTSVAVADFNGDGKPDFVSVEAFGGSGNDVFVDAGYGDGTFHPTTFGFTAGVYPNSVVVADFTMAGASPRGRPILTGVESWRNKGNPAGRSSGTISNTPTTTACSPNDVKVVKPRREH